MLNVKRMGFLFLTISFLSLLQLCYADPPLPTPVGRVVWVKGTLTATMENKEVRTLQKTSIIYLKDTLATDANTTAQIVFTDNTLMSFRPSTTFFIDKYDFHSKPQNGSVGTYFMRLIEGGFRTVTGLIAKNHPSDYQVVTPVATIGVRGTDYAVYVHNGELFVGYYSGEPCVKNKQGEQCMSPTIPYVTVPNAQNAPVPVKQQPVPLKEQLEIVPATIAPFGSAVSGLPTGGGTVSSFCIQ